MPRTASPGGRARRSRSGTRIEGVWITSGPDTDDIFGCVLRHSVSLGSVYVDSQMMGIYSELEGQFCGFTYVCCLNADVRVHGREADGKNLSPLRTELDFSEGCGHTSTHEHSYRTIKHATR